MIFSEKALRASLIIGSAAVSLVLWFFALSLLMQNISLKSQVRAKIYQWEVEEVKSDRYALMAYYSYEWNDRTYQGSTLFRPAYLNEVSAISGLKDEAKLSWSVWLDPSNPKRSSLEKIVPVSLILRASISTLVMLYFIFIYRRKYLKIFSG